MPWWRFWDKTEEAAPEPRAPSRRTATVGTLPAHPTERPTPIAPPLAGEQRERRLIQLRTRWEGVRFDVERAEEATRPDNPWGQRIALLDEAIATVEADLASLDSAKPAPGFPLPPTPISDVRVTTGDQAEVRFRVGNEAFHFAEEVDWDQRGGPVVRGDLRLRSGDAARLVPGDAPPDRRDDLARHLRDSVVVFATDLRDRALDGEPPPASPTLSDLARPCPECGGWRDWRGTCEACVQRAWQRQQLRAEADRLAAEQTREEDERHRWAERLPIARRRLADIDAEIASLGG
jgi:hypothetical protein